MTGQFVFRQSDFSSTEEEEDVDVADQYDSGVIRCICDDPSDDGFTIQCEHCLDWQHASCVNVKRNRIPKHYLCDRCSRLIKKKRPTDIQNRRRNLQESKLLIKEKRKRLDNKSKKDNHEGSDDDEDLLLPAQKINRSYAYTSKCIIKQKAVLDIFKDVRHYWFQLNRQKTSISLDAAIVKGLDSLVVMESNLLMPSIPKTSVKPLRKSMRSSYNNEKIPSLEKGVFADIHIPEDRYLMEVTGEVKLKSEYKSNSSNRFSLLATPLRHVFFYRSLDVYIDAREVGNDARFIRRSCRPNSEIRSIILPNDNDDNLIHMGIYTIEELDKGEEVTIGWNWQRGQLMYQKHQEFLKSKGNLELRKSEPEVKSALKKFLTLYETEFGECACEDKDECFIECIKEELENDSDSEATEMKPLLKRRRPGRPRLSESTTKTTNANSSDEEQRPKSRKRVASSDTIGKPVFVKKSSSVGHSRSTSIEEAVKLDTAPITNMNSLNLNSSKEIIEESLIRRLHCKKRWLQLYLLEQKSKENTKLDIMKVEQLSTAITMHVTSTETTSVVQSEQLLNNKNDEYLSDASSESTLPLNDTPSSPPSVQMDQPKIETPLESESLPIRSSEETNRLGVFNGANGSCIEARTDTTVEQSKEQRHDDTNQNDKKPDEPLNSSSVPLKECAGPSETQAGTAENKPVARVKLSIQEYLSMRRNLSTD
ncbi:hypothetical protein BCV72DRAFT_303128 [Rhizopus microsporus var. microsporus]|uniref:SET domain-containing protein n=1 Tax=Rhizopus microsporus var. microsporus TaxID=86635 RepID=A0A1X0RAK0_RHIZD|nr:hypothetical protein BCV72DRAFT_303128 [Rhizopus microsporus var. microsporus]